MFLERCETLKEELDIAKKELSKAQGHLLSSVVNIEILDNIFLMEFIHYRFCIVLFRTNIPQHQLWKRIDIYEKERESSTK